MFTPFLEIYNNSLKITVIHQLLSATERSLKGLLEGITVVNAKELKNFVLPP